MSEKKIIAIPTDDGETVRRHFRGSRGYYVVRTEHGCVLHQEMRWNLLSEILTSGHGVYYNLVDCDVVIVNEIGDGHLELLVALQKKVVRTEEPDVRGAIGIYLEQVRRKLLKKKPIEI